MEKTIIFLSGWLVPKFISRSKLVWDQPMWSDYRTIYIHSKTPTSNGMVENELNRLQNIVDCFPSAAVVGHSLGGWWASNLALQPGVNIPKLVLWTPLGDTEPYPIFNVTDKYKPNTRELTVNSQPHRVLTVIAKEDLIVPPPLHGRALARHFNSLIYELDGGHFYQKNHHAGLSFMKDWIET